MKQQGALSRGQRKRAKNAQRVRNRMNFASVIGKKHNDEGVSLGVADVERGVDGRAEVDEQVGAKHLP